MTILDGVGLTPGMTVSTALYAMLIPVVGWLVTNGIRTLKAFTMVDAKVRDNCLAITALEKSHATVDSRVVKVEEAIHAIRESSQRKDEQFAAITAKLDQLPALATMLQVLTSSAPAIVPRTEVESRRRAAETRLEMLEKDVREKRTA